VSFSGRTAVSKTANGGSIPSTPAIKLSASAYFMACYTKQVHYTYILYSTKDKKLYIGSTSNLKRRIKEHQSGKVFATKGRLPVKLIFYEAFTNTKDAVRRERYFKTNSGKRSLRLMLREFYKSLS
jgi:putative endonuclease